eukprot:snap_masked-scaffold_13-processed-gene-7.21-mRNA-1 protein AED:1.00 eAED:1.00 QI:0/0/0/0/1/1/2/0/60
MNRKIDVTEEILQYVTLTLKVIIRIFGFNRLVFLKIFYFKTEEDITFENILDSKDNICYK